MEGELVTPMQRVYGPKCVLLHRIDSCYVCNFNSALKCTVFLFAYGNPYRLIDIYVEIYLDKNKQSLLPIVN